MFNQSVSRLDCFPRSMMDKVCVRKEGLDDTLFMTASILLYNRVNDLKLTYAIKDINELESISQNPDVFSFHLFENMGVNPDEVLKPYKNNFKKIDKLPTHEKFLSDQLKQPVFIRLMPNENTVCIFTTQVTYSMWHCIQFFIPKFFQIFKEKPITKEETSFLETLTYRMNGNYITKLTELANTDSFRNYLLKIQLDAFEKKMFEKKVRAAQNSLDEIYREMEEAMNTYRRACNRQIEAMALVSGLESMADKIDEHTELQDYLTSNPRICNVTINDSYISFIVKTIFAPHHISEWETISSANRVFARYTNEKFKNPKDIKLILDAIMGEKRCLRLKMCAYFSMDYFGSEVKSSTNYNYAGVNASLKDYIPNPHLQHHNCFGQNKTAILDQLKCGDAVGAIECAIACAQRINIHDMSFNEFVPDLLLSKGKCFITEDGTEMTVDEALSYLKGKNND